MEVKHNNRHMEAAEETADGAPASPPTPAGAPKLQSAQLEMETPLSQLGDVKVNLDLTGLQSLLQGLTSALDSKFDSVCNQLGDLQASMASQQKYLEITRREVDEATTRLASCVSYRELDDIKAMEGRLRAAFGAQLSQLQGEALGGIAKLTETKADREVVDRLIARESVERLATMEMALHQQRLITLEQRHESLTSEVTTTRTEVRRVLKTFGSRLEKFRLVKRIKSDASRMQIVLRAWKHLTAVHAEARAKGKAAYEAELSKHAAHAGSARAHFLPSTFADWPAPRAWQSPPQALVDRAPIIRPGSAPFKSDRQIRLGAGRPPLPIPCAPGGAPGAVPVPPIVSVVPVSVPGGAEAPAP